MSTYTLDDFMECQDIEAKSHICLHLIKDYEVQVQIPMMSDDDYPLDALQFHAYSSQLQGLAFQDRYAAILMDADTGETQNATVAPLILCGIYEGFAMLISGHESGAVPTEVVTAYGAMMVASARPFFYLLAGCDI